MEWEKSPEEMIELFDGALPDHAEIQRRKMFGYPSGFVNGNLFSGLYSSSMFVRLPERQRNELLSLEGANLLEPMQGRVMREYVVLPQSILRDNAALQDWLERAYQYGLTLPGKATLPKTRK
jgi:TfoX/Sxy family transcriptional regulator of competence genes